jgi:hypothetical protein
VFRLLKIQPGHHQAQPLQRLIGCGLGLQGFALLNGATLGLLPSRA